MQIFIKEIHQKRKLIFYGCITDTLNKNGIEYISKKEASKILSKHKIKAKLLPGYGNAELKKKEIKPYVEEKPFIKVWLILNKNSTPTDSY